MFIIYTVLMLWLTHWFFLVYVNRQAIPLISSLRGNVELYEKAGNPSNYYFWLEFIQLKYDFALFLWKNPLAPENLAFDNKKYRFIRKLSNSLLIVDMLRGITIILALFFSQLIIGLFSF